MSLINMAKREINCKVVYYGIGLSGKTTNLHIIHRTVNPRDVGEMVSIDTETERTLYFDLLPLELGRVHGFHIRFQLYTVPGQVVYERTRVAVLSGVDGVVFVADSAPEKLEENYQSLIELENNMQRMGKDLGNFPFVMQWNKRDLPGALPIATMEHYLNRRRVQSFPAIAVRGEGVLATLRAMCVAVMNRL